ncbi:universal stress protein [Microbacterium sp. YJN-G]|uniref:universal stress protein n=1 Tax=Microbacterium sp. YJN-G TaxID=2763257 RepID=UPI00187752C9|nr:universal stress protein [Microbacterium sp. YJN-G]
MASSAKAPVLVGVDGSDSSLGALRYATRLATALGAPLRVVTTWEYPPLVDVMSSAEWSPEADAAMILESSLNTVFAGEPPEDMTTAVLPGPASPALIDESGGAEMLVLGNRGRGGFASLLLGSVSSACVTHAHCPVVVVHRTSGGPPTGSGAISRCRRAPVPPRTPPPGCGGPGPVC